MILSVLMFFGMKEQLAKLLAPVVMALLVILSYVLVFYAGEWKKDREWQGKIDTYKAQLATAKKTIETEYAAYKHDTDLLVDAMKGRINDLIATSTKVRVVIKEVKTYVTEKADAGCTVTAGAVWLYNLPLGGELAGVPGDRPADVDAPSGVALSGFVATAADNNVECVERGRLLKEWQDWYPQVKKRYEELRKRMPTMPEVPG